MKNMGIKNLGVLAVGIVGIVSLIGASNLQTIDSSTQVIPKPNPIIIVPEPTISGTIVGFLISAGLFAVLLGFALFMKSQTERENLCKEVKQFLEETEEEAKFLYQTGYYEKSLSMFEGLITKMLEVKQKLGKEFNAFLQSFEDAQRLSRNAKIHLTIQSVKSALEIAEQAFEMKKVDEGFKLLNRAAIECKEILNVSKEWNLEYQIIECQNLENKINKLCIACFDNL